MQISIIVPIDGEGDYPQHCLDSLLEQSCSAMEILVIPYGIMPQWQLPADSRFWMPERAERTLTDALNRGIGQAEGDYILFLDPDTWMDPNSVQLLLDEAEAEELDLLRFGCIREYRTRNLVAKLPFVSQEVCRGEAVETVCRQTVGLIGNELAYTERINGLSMANFCLYRKAIMDEHELRFENVADVKLFSDCLFNIGYLLQARSFRYMEIAICHCETPQSYGLSPVYRENYLARQQQFFQKLRVLAEAQKDPRFMEAYFNRVIFSTPDICLNALKSDKVKKEQYGEIKALKTSAQHRAAYKTLELRQLPAAWKMYYFYAKYGLMRRLYSMTKTIRAYQK